MGMKFALLLAFICVTLGVSAQDAQMSLNTTSPLEINPAATGFLHTDKNRVWINYRNQWGSFLKKGVVSASASYDVPLKGDKVGLGIIFAQNGVAGGHIQDFSVYGSFAYNALLDKREGHYLSFGLQGGIKQKSFNMSQLTFDEQWRPGDGYMPNLYGNNESFPSQSKMYPDFNFGMVWYVKEPWKKTLPWGGFAIHHLLEPDESFYDNVESRIPRKMIFNGGLNLQMTRNIGISPEIMLKMQGESKQALVGISGNINNFRDKVVTAFSLGGYYRTEDAFVATAGFRYKDYSFLFDYDINISTLKAPSKSIGGIEITVHYIQSNDKKRNHKFF